MGFTKIIRGNLGSAKFSEVILGSPKFFEVILGSATSKRLKTTAVEGT